MIIMTARYKFNTYNMFFEALSLNIIMYILSNVIFTFKDIKQIQENSLFIRQFS